MARRGMKAGWYADPAVPERHRFWDGRAWTRWLATRRRAPLPPRLDLDPVVPVESRADRVVAALKWAVVAVVFLAVVATVAGMVVNRREATRNPVVWHSQNTPAATVTRGYEYPFKVSESGQIDLGRGAATAQLPAAPWKSDRAQAVEGMFKQSVLSSVPDSARDGGLDAVTVSGVLHWVVLPAEREQAAAGLAQLAVARLFGKIEGVSHEPAETKPLDAFGARHPGAEATMAVTWPGGGTVMMARVVQIDDGAWLGWLSTQGPELSDRARAELDRAWQQTSFADR